MQGIGVSPGISIGTAFVIRNSVSKVSGRVVENDELRRNEIERFDNAVLYSVGEIEKLIGKKHILSQTETDILEAQVELLSDPQIRSDVIEKIKNESRTADDAVIEVIAATVSIFENIEDEYLRARSADIDDIGKRILRNLGQISRPGNIELPQNSIVIAEDITPSDAISFDITKVAGFATSRGGRTSHTSIIARSRSIPAVTGCGDEIMNVQNNDLVLIDGSTGEVIFNPDLAVIDEFRIRKEKYTREITLLRNLRELPATTSDGKRICLYANISGPDDLENVLSNGGEGIGLFRTEMLFMNRITLPDELEQFTFYKEVAEKLNGKPLIIRTLDIGGDKKLPYLELPSENNPFLGYRAIRLCLDRKDLFMIQIRAILRASDFGNLRIMFPMISGIAELRQARECVQQAEEDLTRNGIRFNREIKTGIMIEIPAAALMADQLAREADFFSIGTNDLCQYTIAVDRMNERVASLYSHFHPAVLRLIHNVIDQARKNNIHAGLCGEMASDPLAAVLLMGMGLEEFSMSAGAIPVIKNIIRHTSLSEAREVFNKVKDMDDPEKITGYLKSISE